MKWVRFSTLSFTFTFFGIRLSTIQHILYGALLAFTTFLFLRFSSPLVGSSFTILRGVRAFVVRFGSVFSWVTLGGLVHISFQRAPLIQAQCISIYAFQLFLRLFFACFFCFFVQVGVWGSGTGRMLGSSFFYPVFCGFFSPVPYFSSGVFFTLSDGEETCITDWQIHTVTYTPTNHNKRTGTSS